MSGLSIENGLPQCGFDPWRPSGVHRISYSSFNLLRFRQLPVLRGCQPVSPIGSRAFSCLLQIKEETEIRSTTKLGLGI